MSPNGALLRWVVFLASQLWGGDDFFAVGGGTFTTTGQIQGSGGNPIYLSERFLIPSVSNTLRYDLPLEDGTYLLRLHFAEIFFTSPGQRQFDVQVGSTTIRSNLDIVAEVGPKAALVVEAQVQVTGQLLKLRLRTGAADVPKINGIEVLPATPA